MMQVGLDGIVMGNYRISTVAHKSIVKSNEEGIGAVVIIVIFRNKCWHDPLDFGMDYLFMFIMRDDRNGVIMFMGYVPNPPVEGN
ncbi:hypothetical protein GIB67_037598 [Kingdonia uniflora]|uniref:Serpin domain-containing protein n=1 Tax=Kingdonia uniflora TaxID=39325 RepID=A0A7J7LSC3_9MAGN|nr:hypothetical protein GIB67_037598 [Kingdonia uniflora]